MGTLIAYCDWCWRWDSLYIPDGIGLGLCGRCIDRIIHHQRASEGGLEELRPPWQPDARARRASQLYLAGIRAIIATLVARFEIEQWEP